MNNDYRRDQKPEGGSAVKLVIAAVVAIFVFADTVGIGGGSVLFIILVIGAIAAVAIGIAKQAQSEGKKGEAGDAADVQKTQAEPAKREFKPAHFDMSKFTGKRDGESISKRLTEKMRDDLSHCDDDHDHVEPGYRASDEEKRAEQLKELLRNGLIEKDEYNILMRKFGLK